MVVEMAEKMFKLKQMMQTHAIQTTEEDSIFTKNLFRLIVKVKNVHGAVFCTLRQQKHATGNTVNVLSWMLTCKDQKCVEAVEVQRSR